MTTGGNPCPACGNPTSPGDRFCEVCGQNLALAAQPAQWLSSRAAAGAPCVGCGSTEIGADGYCGQCGRRRSTGQDHAELDLDPVGGATDRGRHKHRNEDALAIGRIGGFTVAVVCDGVSSSPEADDAAYAGAEKGMTTILDALSRNASARDATESAARSAAAAVARQARPENRDAAPSCTYVSAVVSDDEVTVGWVGDSRAYWLAPDGSSAQLTTDDNLGVRLAAAAAARQAGTPDPGVPGWPAGEAPVLEGPSDPRAAALVRWLGADSIETEPTIVAFRPTAPGVVVVCSDGLHRYLGDPAAMAAVVAQLPERPVAVAAALTQLAVEAGGVDNIAVAVLPVRRPDGSDTSAGGFTS